jgi:hypothetical protein
MHDLHFPSVSHSMSANSPFCISDGVRWGL